MLYVDEQSSNAIGRGWGWGYGSTQVTLNVHMNCHVMHMHLLFVLSFSHCIDCSSDLSYNFYKIEHIFYVHHLPYLLEII